MKKSLLILALGLVVSAFMIGCAKPEEGDPAGATKTEATKTDDAAK